MKHCATRNRRRHERRRHDRSPLQIVVMISMNPRSTLRICHPERSEGPAVLRHLQILRGNAKRGRYMRRSMLLFFLGLTSLFAQAQTAKPKLTLDEFFNSVSFDAVKLSPDGNNVVIAAERPDWEQQIFPKELWLYRAQGSGSLIPLTQSGHDKSPQWSPDGQWIAFLAERKTGDGKDADAGDDEKDGRGKSKDKDKDKDAAQLYLISPNGGEAFAITSGEEEVHAFAWSSDSKAIYFATRQPWTKQQNDDHKKDWKDVIRYRGDERGDVIFRITLDEVLARRATLGSKEIPDAEKDSGATPGAVAIARTPLRVG